MTALTVLVAGLSEGLPLGENDGHSQILEGRHVEEGGVLVVSDVLVVHIGLVSVGHWTGNVAGTTKQERKGGRWCGKMERTKGRHTQNTQLPTGKATRGNGTGHLICKFRLIAFFYYLTYNFIVTQE